MEYQPINRQYHDRLKAWATLGKPCEITYLKEDKPVTVTTKILDLRTVKSSDYLFGENNLVIRLDKLIAVNGIPLEPQNRTA